MATDFPVYVTLAAIFWIGVTLLIFPSIRKFTKRLLLPTCASNQSHLPCIDGFRGLAALYIAVFHTWQWTSPAFTDLLLWAPFITKGEKAVPIFVTLSGLLIYRSLSAINNLGGMRNYLTRRFFRIYPTYFLTVIVTAIFIPQFNNGIQKYQFVIAEIFMMRSLGFPAFSNPQSWSLYVEVLFYLLAPIFVSLATRRPILWAMAAIIIFSISDVQTSRELRLWKYFFFGIVAAELINKSKLRELWSTALALLGALIILIDLKTNYDWIAASLKILSANKIIIAGGYPSYTLTLGVGILMLIVGSTRSPIFYRIFDLSIMRILGTISYSLFMWHSFIILANFPIVFDGQGGVYKLNSISSSMPTWFMPLAIIPAMIMVATLSYIFIERPFLLHRTRLSQTLK